MSLVPIPALNPVNNAAGVAALNIVAGPIVFGGAIGTPQAKQAGKEHRQRKRARKANHVLVTSNEVTEAKIREHAILNQVVRTVYGIPPAEATVIAIDARLRNKRALKSGAAAPLVPVPKTTVGAPAGILGSFAAPGVAFVTAAVGALPPAVFPTTVGDINALSHANLTTLAHFYNDSFGCVAGDHLNVERTNFRYFIGY